MDKFCRDCVHMVFKEGQKKPTCGSPKNIVPHIRHEQFLVTGIMPEPVQAIRGATCAALRTDHGKMTNALICGPEGKWWEPKAV